MIALYIIGGIILLILLFLLLPFTAQVDFDNEFLVKIKCLGITLYKFMPDEEEEKEKPETTDKQKSVSKEKEKGTFERLKEKHGFKGAVNELFTLFNDILRATKKHLLKIKFRKVKVDLIVVGSDASMTAVEYGAVCGIVYPVISFIDQKLDVKLKKINVEAGFKHAESKFGFSVDIKANSVLLLIIAVKALKEYKNFSVRNELQ